MLFCSNYAKNYASTIRQGLSSPKVVFLVTISDFKEQVSLTGKARVDYLKFYTLTLISLLSALNLGLAIVIDSKYLSIVFHSYNSSFTRLEFV